MMKWLYQENGKSKSGEGLKYPVSNNGMIWLLAVSPTEPELTKLSRDFSLPMNMLKSYGKERRSVRYSFSPFACTFVDYELSGEKIKRTNVLFFVSENFLITILQGPVDSYERVFSDLKGSKAAMSPVMALIEILDADIEENYDVLEHIENQITEIEHEVASKKRGNIEKVVELRRTLNRMSRALWGSSRITYFMRTGVGSLKVSEHERGRIDDMHQSLIHQIDMTSNHKETLTDTITIYQTNISNWLATISNRINASIKLLTWVMLVLTGLTLVLTVPNTIATIFGIPYFGLSSNVSQYIVELLIASIIIPAVLFFYYWRIIRKKAEEAELRNV